MTTAFPAALDNFQNPANNTYQDAISHAGQHSNANDAIEALEAKVGIDNSANTDSQDYKINWLETTLANREFNVMRDGGAVGNNSTNDYAAFLAAFASGAKYVVVPYYNTLKFYLSGDILDIPAGCELRGLGGSPTLRQNSALNTSFFRINAVEGAGITNIILDGGYSATNATASLFIADGTTKAKVENVSAINAKGFGIYLGGCSYSRFINIRAENCQNSGIEVAETGTYGNVIQNYTAKDNVGMGIRVSNGAHYNQLDNINCQSNGLELIGMTYDCYGNNISNVIAQGTGDNGVSITGYNNGLVNITAFSNANNGLGLYGSNNRCTNISASNNNQSGSGFSGIAIAAGYGGAASGNLLDTLHTYDDQSVHTQTHGAVLGAGSYAAFNSGTTYAVRSFISNASKCYVSTTTIASGGAAPTHTSGTVGGWKYIFTTTTSFHATQNRIGSQYGYGNTGSLLQDDATSGTNYAADFTVL